MSKYTNNFMSTPDRLQYQACKAAAPSYEDPEEEPEEVCVPEGPAYGATTPYRPATARSSARSLNSSPAAQTVPTARQEYSFEPRKVAAVNAAITQLSDLDLGQEADSCSSPVDTGPVGRRRPPSAMSPAHRNTTAMAPTPPSPSVGRSHDSRPAAVSQGVGLAQGLAAHSQNPQSLGIAHGRAAHPPGHSAAVPKGMGHPAGPRVPSKQELLMQPAARPCKATGLKGSGWGEMVMEDVDDLGGGAEQDVIPVPWGSVGTPRGTGGSTTGMHARGASLTVEQARGLRELLWGTAGTPPASWKQGFFFSNQPGLAYGLVQLEGGPCGIIASVQAYVLANLKSDHGAFNLCPTATEQLAALVSSLTDIIWQAHRGPTAVLAVASGEGASSAASLGYDQLVRNVTLCEASSKEQLQALLQQSLGCYSTPQGWGVVLLLVSVLLSQGLQAVQGSMDDQTTSLMGMHGYCTQELVNLLIAGEAASNVFDGIKDLDGSSLRGITRRCRVGLLTLFEWYKYVEVGRCLKSPDLPIWVVCSESHFTVLFSQDSRALRGKLPCDFYYYDELARQTEPIRLTMCEDPEGGWTARVGDSMTDRGRYEGQNIPPLECVIETRWPGVRVVWNGSDPIL